MSWQSIGQHQAGEGVGPCIRTPAVQINGSSNQSWLFFGKSESWGRVNIRWRYACCPPTWYWPAGEHAAKHDSLRKLAGVITAEIAVAMRLMAHSVVPVRARFRWLCTANWQ